MRIFVALPLPDPIRRHLAGLRSGLPGARWVAPENMHVTLRFIGEVEGDEVDEVDAALAEIRVPVFDVSVGGIGFFDRGRKVHAVWAGIEAEGGLERLQRKVESAIVRAGFEPERRKFKPHVTIARLRGTPAHHVGTYIEAHDGFASDPFRADHFTLFRSHLGREGAVYEALADYTLDES